MTKRNQLADTLRRAIRESGLTAYRLGLDAGVRPEVISRFMDGTRSDIRISTAGKLAEVLGLELRATTRKGK